MDFGYNTIEYHELVNFSFVLSNTIAFQILKKKQQLLLNIKNLARDIKHAKNIQRKFRTAKFTLWKHQSFVNEAMRFLLSDQRLMPLRYRISNTH